MADYWGPASGGYQLMARVTWTQNIANNTSTVRTVIYMVVPQWVSTSSAYFGLVIGGVTKYSTSTAATYGKGTHVVMDASQTITHRADGTQNVTIASSVIDNINGFFNVQVNVPNLTLPTIPRATTPNFSGAMVTGSAKTINLPRASSSFTHDVTYKFGSLSGTIATGAGVTASWTPPHSLLTAIPSATSGLGTITVRTKSGSTTVGTKSVGFRLNAAASQVPTVSAVTWEDTNTDVASKIGAFVQGLSTIRGTVTAAGIQGSTITKRETTIAGKTVTQGTVLTPTTSGTVSASGKATDSRSRTATRTANITVLPYESPAITALEVYRANAAGARDEAGTRLYARWDMAVSSLVVGGTEKNRRSLRISTRTGTGAWVQRNQGTYTNLSVTNGGLYVGGGSVYLETQSYDVRVEVWDELGQVTTAETTVPTSAVALDLNGTSVGVGKYWERGALDVGGTIYATDLKLAAGPGRILWTGAIYMQGSQTATLSDLVSNQLTGIMLVWSRWTGTSAADDSFNFTTIPKTHVAQHPGSGVYALMSRGSSTTTTASKYVYVHDDRITGNAINATAPEDSYVLRYVIGI